MTPCVAELACSEAGEWLSELDSAIQPAEKMLIAFMPRPYHQASRIFPFSQRQEKCGEFKPSPYLPAELVFVRSRSWLQHSAEPVPQGEKQRQRFFQKECCDGMSRPAPSGRFRRKELRERTEQPCLVKALVMEWTGLESTACWQCKQNGKLYTAPRCWPFSPSFHLELASSCVAPVLEATKFGWQKGARHLRKVDTPNS